MSQFPAIQPANDNSRPSIIPKLAALIITKTDSGKKGRKASKKTAETAMAGPKLMYDGTREFSQSAERKEKASTYIPPERSMFGNTSMYM